MCFWRHLSPGAAKDVLQASTPYHDWIIGVGLDAAEIENPPSKFDWV